MPRPYAALALAAGLLTVAPAHAATVPAVAGQFLDHPLSSFTVDIVAVSGVSFGTATLAGDNISFTPTAFTSGPIPVSGPVLGGLTGTVTLVLRPKEPTTQIASLRLQETGDYWLDDAAPAGAAMNAAFQLLARNETGNTTSSNVIANTGLLATTGMFNLTAWSLDGTVDSAPPGGWDSVPGGVVRVVVQNNLNWWLGQNDSGFIQKKDAGMRLDVNAAVIPLPAAGWMLLSGLAALAVTAHRRRTRADATG